MSGRVLNSPMSESVLISILLPVSINALCAALRGLQTMEFYEPDATFTRQVGMHFEVFECDPPPSSYISRGDGDMI